MEAEGSSRVLDLESREILSLQQSLKYRNVKEVLLSGNKIVLVPPFLLDLPFLEFLDLTNNYVFTVADVLDSKAGELQHSALDTSHTFSQKSFHFRWKELTQQKEKLVDLDLNPIEPLPPLGSRLRNGFEIILPMRKKELDKESSEACAFLRGLVAGSDSAAGERLALVLCSLLHEIQTGRNAERCDALRHELETSFSEEANCIVRAALEALSQRKDIASKALSQLRELRLSCCSLGVMTRAPVPSSLTSLTSLSLESCEVGLVSQSCFLCFHRLQRLSLFDNDVSFLHSSFFPPSLLSLDCRLNRLNDRALASLRLYLSEKEGGSFVWEPQKSIRIVDEGRAILSSSLREGKTAVDFSSLKGGKDDMKAWMECLLPFSESLTGLNLSRNDVTSLSRERLSSFRKLKYLDISFCGLFELPTAVETYDRQLEMKIEGNYLSDETTEASLKRYTIIGNTTQCRPYSVEEFFPLAAKLRDRNIEKLDLRNSRLTDAEFAALSCVCERHRIRIHLLDVRNNYLMEDPTALFSFATADCKLLLEGNFIEDERGGSYQRPRRGKEYALAKLYNTVGRARHKPASEEQSTAFSGAKDSLKAQWRSKERVRVSFSGLALSDGDFREVMERAAEIVASDEVEFEFDFANNFIFVASSPPPSPSLRKISLRSNRLRFLPRWLLKEVLEGAIEVDLGDNLIGGVDPFTIESLFELDAPPSPSLSPQPRETANAAVSFAASSAAAVVLRPLSLPPSSIVGRQRELEDPKAWLESFLSAVSAVETKSVRLQCLVSYVWPMQQREFEREIGRWLERGLSEREGVEELRLSRNELSFLPERVSCFSSVTSLSVDHNALVTLPSSIGDCSQLQTLQCSHNRLLFLPPSLFDCRSLLTLDVSHNFISTIPDRVERLTSLERLRLHQNFLLPQETETLLCRALPHLPRSGLGLGEQRVWPSSWLENAIQIAADANCSLLILDSWRIDDEDLDHALSLLPSSTSFFLAVTSLSLRQNTLKQVPSALMKCYNLRFLDLSECGLERVPSGVWELRFLTELYLSGNNIVSPKALSIKSLALQLQRLHLQSNYLTLFPSAILSFPRLHFVDASNNFIVTLRTVSKVPNGCAIDLRSNCFDEREGVALTKDGKATVIVTPSKRVRSFASTLSTLSSLLASKNSDGFDVDISASDLPILQLQSIVAFLKPRDRAVAFRMRITKETVARIRLDPNNDKCQGSLLRCPPTERLLKEAKGRITVYTCQNCEEHKTFFQNHDRSMFVAAYSIVQSTFETASGLTVVEKKAKRSDGFEVLFEGETRLRDDANRPAEALSRESFKKGEKRESRQSGRKRKCCLFSRANEGGFPSSSLLLRRFSAVFEESLGTLSWPPTAYDTTKT